MSRERIQSQERRGPLEAGINVICGPMFSGKSNTLITELSRLPHAGHKIQIFFPEVDDRRDTNTINSYLGAKLYATPVKNALELEKLVKPETNVVGIDEAQFLDMDLFEVCMEFADQGKTVYVAGLDRDFKGEPFGPMAILKEFAEDVTTLHAFCKECKGEASFTQRMIIELDGEGNEVGRRPANYDDPLVVVAGDEDEATQGNGRTFKEYYEARCRSHHDVPGKPKQEWTFVSKEIEDD